MDSGATHHICSDPSFFSYLGPTKEVTGIRTLSGERLEVKGEGMVPVVGQGGHPITFLGVFFVPDLKLSLL